MTIHKNKYLLFFSSLLFGVLFNYQALADSECALESGYELPVGVEFYVGCNFSEGLAELPNSSKQWGAVNSKGDIIIPYNNTF